MNIVILNDFAYINGGIGQVALPSSVAFANKGYFVLLFTAVGPISPFLKNVSNLNVICLNQSDILNDPKRWRAMLNGIWNKKASDIFGKTLDTLDRKDTIIHVHACAKALSTSCIHIALQKKFKVIFHMHDYGLACPNMGFFHYPRQQICKLEPLSYRCMKTNCDSRSYPHKMWRCLRQFIQIKYGGLPDQIKYFVTVSDFSCQILKKYLPKEANIFFVPNPIEVRKKAYIKAEENKSIIFVGRLVPEKNPVLLAKAANKLNLSVIFIGSGSCEQEIKENCPHAVITGWLDAEQIEAYMQKARYLVLTSSCYETQGMVVPEAAARGVPTIVPDTCAARESIVINKSGMLFKSNDSASLEEVLIKMQDNDMVKSMGRFAYETFWEKENDMNNYIQNMMKIYNQIL